MANFKRNKPRARTQRGYSRRAGNARFEKHHFAWMCSWPAWWDIIYHRRPMRARGAAIERQVMKGVVDADNAVWPLSKKPHQYYW